MTQSKRKPHNGLAGYVAEKRNPITSGHTIIFDCKKAEEQGAALVESFRDEGGPYQVVCNEHGTLIHLTNLPAARSCMKDTTEFCDDCRAIMAKSVKLFI